MATAVMITDNPEDVWPARSWDKGIKSVLVQTPWPWSSRWQGWGDVGRDLCHYDCKSYWRVSWRPMTADISIELTFLQFLVKNATREMVNAWKQCPAGSTSILLGNLNVNLLHTMNWNFGSLGRNDAGGDGHGACTSGGGMPAHKLTIYWHARGIGGILGACC